MADPGYAYRLFLTGTVDTNTDTTGTYPLIRVRRGSNTGPIVALGSGPNEAYYAAGTPQSFLTAGSFTYPVPSAMTDLDIVVLGAGGGGSGFFNPNGGGAGSFASAHLLYGTTLPLTTTSLAVTVGAAGASQTTGGNSVVSGAGITTLTGTGGTNGGSGSAAGGSPGTLNFDAQNYVGGVAQPTADTVGFAPGGGGGGGTTGGPGTPGAVWFLAYDKTTSPAGPAIVAPVALDLQTTLTGATTLYVMLARHGSTGTVRATTVRPALMAIPIPA